MVASDKWCLKCDQPMVYLGASVIKEDTGEHYLCGIVHDWTCTTWSCSGSAMEPDTDPSNSWVEEYDDPATWRDHAAVERMAEDKYRAHLTA